MNLKFLFAAAALSLVPVAGQANTVIVYTDNASNYSGDYNSQGGSTPGFGAFVVKTSTIPNSNYAGTFIGTAAKSEDGSAAGMDSGGNSFGFYANGSSGAGSPSVTITRSFNIPTQPTGLVNTGDIFSLDFATGYNDGGTSGVALTNSSGNVGSFFYNHNELATGGSQGAFDFNGANTGIGYNSGILHLTYKLTAPTTYSFTSTGAVTYAGTFIAATPVTGFLVQQTNSAGGDNHNGYFNNLSLTAAPEPSQMAAITFTVLGLGGLLLRRRQVRVN